MACALSTKYDATSLQESAMIEALFKNPNDWALKRILENTSIETYRTFKQSTLLLIRYLYKHKQNIMNRIAKYIEKTLDDIIWDITWNDTNSSTVIRMLEEIIDYNELSEGLIHEIWLFNKHNEKIIRRIPNIYLKDGWWYKTCDECRITGNALCEICDKCGICTISNRYCNCACPTCGGDLDNEGGCFRCDEDDDEY